MGKGRMRDLCLVLSQLVCQDVDEIIAETCCLSQAVVQARQREDEPMSSGMMSIDLAAISEPHLQRDRRPFHGAVVTRFVEGCGTHNMRRPEVDGTNIRHEHVSGHFQGVYLLLQREGHITWQAADRPGGIK